MSMKTDSLTLRLALFVAVAGAALLSMGLDCGWRQQPFPVPLSAPIGPDSTWTGAINAFGVTVIARKDNIRYVMDWGDKTDTTEGSFASGETAVVAHQWNTAGTQGIKVQAFLASKPDVKSEWSPTKSVKVIPDSRPVIDEFYGPPVAVKGVEAFFTVKAHDPDGDSIRTIVDWGDSTDTTTGFFLSPCSVEVTHVFAQAETDTVVFAVQDWKGAPSLPETILVPVGRPLDPLALWPDGRRTSGTPANSE